MKKRKCRGYFRNGKSGILRITAVVIACLMTGAILFACKSGDDNGNEGEKEPIMSKEYFDSLYNGVTAISAIDIGVETITFAQDGARYKVALNGKSKKKSLSTEVGVAKREWNAVEVAEGGRIDVTLDFSAQFKANGKTKIFLEVQEVHTRADQTIGYTVEVNGKQMCFRTYEQLSAGGNNYFICFDRSIISDPKAVKISFINKGEQAFCLNKAWLYDDFFTLAEQEDIYQKMEINGLYNSITDARAIERQYPDSFTMYDIGALVGVMYMQNDTATTNRTVNQIIANTAQVDFPIHIMPSRWWGGTPMGPDGEGGYFSDLEYGQILYNPIAGEYQASIPNGWSNTYWASMNHPTANAAAKENLESIFKNLMGRYSLTQTKDSDLYMYSLYLEHGIGYWPTGDYSDFVVEAAKKDGVDLVADNWLTDAEKIWFYKNMAKYFDFEAEAVKTGLGKSSILVNKGEITYPSAQMYDNIYSHGVQGGLPPSNDNYRISGWEAGMGDNMWPSYEVYVFCDYRYYDYVMAHGKNACANLEMTMINTAQFQKYIKDMYASGAVYVTMFNQKAGGENDAIKAIDNKDNEKANLPQQYNRTSTYVDYLAHYHPDMLQKPDEGVVSYQNLKLSEDVYNLSPDGYIYPAAPNQTGTATYKFSNNGDNFKDGFDFVMQGQLKGVGSSIQIFAGSSPDNLRHIDTFMNGSAVDYFNRNTERVYDLSSIANGKKEIYVQLRLTNGAGTNRAQVRMVRGEIPWGMQSGNSNGYVPTLKESRIQKLWISQKAVTERALKLYNEEGLSEFNTEQKITSNIISQNAKALMDSGMYKSAYKLLAGEMSMLLPAPFAVNTSGKLGRYPIEVTLKKEGNGLYINLLAASDEYYRFELLSDKNQTIDITFSGLSDGSYTLTVDEEGAYVLRKGKADKESLQTVDGKVTFTIQYKMLSTKREKLSEISGKITNYSQGSSIALEIHDAAVSDYAPYISYSLASNVKYTRRAEGSDELKKETPKAGDMATVKFDENGLVTNIEAVYGHEEGKVKSYTPPTLVGQNKTNGIIEMESGNKYELSFGMYETQLQTVVLNGLAKQFDIKTLSQFLKPGDTVAVDYCPYTYNGANKRIIKLLQPVKELFFENFEGDWRSKAVSVSNYTSGAIDNNNPKKCIYPSSNNSSASIVYKFTNTQAIKAASVEYMGRSIIDGLNNTTFYVSTDGQNWKRAHVFQASDSGSDNFNNNRAFGITDYVKKKSTFYLKLETFTTNDTWASINTLRVRVDG